MTQVYPPKVQHQTSTPKRKCCEIPEIGNYDDSFQVNHVFNFGKSSRAALLTCHPGLQVLQGCQAAAILALPSLWYGRVVPLFDGVVGDLWVGWLKGEVPSTSWFQRLLFTDSTMVNPPIKTHHHLENMLMFCHRRSKSKLFTPKKVREYISDMT